MNDWLDLFSNPEFYKFAVKESGYTESVETLEIFGEFLMNYNFEFHNYLRVSLVWDLLDRTSKDSLIFLKFDKQDYSKMFLIMDFLNMDCLSKKIKFDADFRSKFVLNKQLEYLEITNIEYLNGEGKINDKCLYQTIRLSVSNIIGKIDILDGAIGYDLTSGAIGAIVKRGM